VRLLDTDNLYVTESDLVHVLQIVVLAPR
jgi:hypothetical protein